MLKDNLMYDKAEDKRKSEGKGVTALGFQSCTELNRGG